MSIKSLSLSKSYPTTKEIDSFLSRFSVKILRYIGLLYIGFLSYFLLNLNEDGKLCIRNVQASRVLLFKKNPFSLPRIHL